MQSQLILEARKKESGFIMMIVLVIMVVGTASFYGLYTQNQSATFQFEETNKRLQALEDIKARVLNYSIMHSEIYMTSTTGAAKSLVDIPGPGRMPCPNDYADDNKDMLSDCSTQGEVVISFMSSGVDSRHFHFFKQGQESITPPVDQKDYIFVVDRDFVFGNNAAELNADTSADLKLNDDGKDYVALIIDPGKAQVYADDYDQLTNRPAAAAQEPNLRGYLDRRYADYDQTTEVTGNFKQPSSSEDSANPAHAELFKFYSMGRGNFGVNDLIVGISKKEWITVVKTKVCSKAAERLLLPDTVNYWFNAFHAADNPNGGNWRQLVNDGLCDD